MSLNGLPRGFMTSSTVKVSRSHDSVKCLKLKCDQASQGFLVQIVLFWWDFLSYDTKFYPLLRQFIGFWFHFCFSRMTLKRERMWTAVILLVLHSHTFMMAQTDKHGKPTPVHNKSIPAFNMELELMHSTKGKQLVPTDNSEQLASFHVGVPLVERGFNRGHAVSGVQAGPSSRDSPNSERPEQWGRCNTCNSRVHDLSEWDDIPTCSVCRWVSQEFVATNGESYLRDIARWNCEVDMALSLQPLCMKFRSLCSANSLQVFSCWRLHVV